jgi:hypothetical protein
MRNLMKYATLLATTCICTAIVICPSSVRATPPDEPGGISPRVSGGLAIGYDVGLPLQGYVQIDGLATDLPVSFRLSISHTFLLDPGIPLDARHVFINENDNGVPSKSASRWAFGFDMTHPVQILSLKRASLYGGVRYSRFSGTFDFIGGNEFFDVNANQFGIAGGLESFFRMSPRVDLLFSAGLEYYFPATLEGHDAAYSPDGTAVNQRQDYTYDDADNAINQPKLQPKLLIGINYRF